MSFGIIVFWMNGHAKDTPWCGMAKGVAPYPVETHLTRHELHIIELMSRHKHQIKIINRLRACPLSRPSEAQSNDGRFYAVQVCTGLSRMIIPCELLKIKTFQ